MSTLLKGWVEECIYKYKYIHIYAQVYSDGGGGPKSEYVRREKGKCARELDENIYVCIYGIGVVTMGRAGSSQCWLA